MKKTISFLFALAIIISCAVIAFLIVWNYGLIPQIGERLGSPSPIITLPKDGAEGGVNSFSDCQFKSRGVNKEEGYIILEPSSLREPYRCQTPSGKVFVAAEKSPTIQNWRKERCIDTGGIVKTKICCKTMGGFPNTCIGDLCTCSAEDSREVDFCDCGPGKCFDNFDCISIKSIGEIPNEETINWKEYKNEDYRFEFKYPENLFWEEQEPEVGISNCNYNNFPQECPYMGPMAITSKAGKIIINDVPYCYREDSEGAAGTMYVNYYYTTIKNRQCLTVHLLISYANCGTWLEEEPQKQICENRNNEKDKTLEKVISTFEFID